MKKILIPMIEVGGGHRMIALAVKEAIDQLFPGQYQVDVIDFAKEAGAIRDDKAMKDIWDFALAHPRLTTNVNLLLDTFKYLTRSNLVTKVLFQNFIRRGAQYILEYKPDIVFSTHFFCTSVALFARKKYCFQYKVISYMADPITGHNMWVNPEADIVVTATEEAKKYLISQGQPRYRIKVMSFPLNPKFFSKVTKTREEILGSLGLDPSKKTVLASAGSQGIGDTGKYVRFIYEKGYPLNIIAVCARNEALFKELSSMVNKDSHTGIAVLGFVDNMHELLEASDFAITKAGPSTVFEHLVKRVPPILTHSAGLQEKGNADFCLNNKVGWFINNQEELQDLMDRILNTAILEEYRENIERNGFIRSLPQAPYDLARFVIGELATKRKTRRSRKNTGLRRLVLGTRINIRIMMQKHKKTRYRIKKPDMKGGLN
jgi:1,2-diacylglycerol 3-beta-galactosyltransferase